MYAAIVFLPLLGCAIAGLFGRLIGPRPSELVTTGLLLVSAALSVVVFADVALGGGATQIMDRGGRVSRFQKKFAGFIKEEKK